MLNSLYISIIEEIEKMSISFYIILIIFVPIFFFRSKKSANYKMALSRSVSEKNKQFAGPIGYWAVRCFFRSIKRV
jgi:hypothetical protein